MAIKHIRKNILTEEEKGKLMDTILFPARISLLKNMLPKKQPSRRSNSVANLKSTDTKTDSFVSAQSKRETPSTPVKAEAKVNLVPLSPKVEPDKRTVPPSLKQGGASAQPVDPAKFNMSKANSKQEPQLEIISNKGLVPNTHEPRSGNTKINKPLPKDVKPKTGPNNEAMLGCEKLIALDPKKPVPGNSSQRDLPIKGDSGKGKTSSKNVPPSPPTKIDMIKNQGLSSNRPIEKPLLLNAGNKNNSASARKLEPVIAEHKPAMQRQNSASRLSNAIVGNSPVKPESSNGNTPNKAIPKAIEKPLPPSANSFKVPPPKSLVGQPRGSQQEIPRQGRYSTNPSNPMRPNESRDKIIKFDDFIKNFEASNSRLSNLRDQNAGSAGNLRGQRYSSVNPRSRE